MSLTRRHLAAAAAAGAVAGGLVVGGAAAWRDGVHVETATAVSASGAISAEADGWTYDIPTDVAWQDASGAFHDSGRPECLPPSGREEGPVRFEAVTVDADGVRFRQVYFVQCSGAPPLSAPGGR